MYLFKTKYKIQLVYEQGNPIPFYWILKVDYFLGISLFYSLIGQDGNDLVPFQCVENLNYYMQTNKIEIDYGII